MEQNIKDLIILKRPHHERNMLCTSRLQYRQGKKLTAVKVVNFGRIRICILQHNFFLFNLISY